MIDTLVCPFFEKDFSILSRKRSKIAHLGDTDEHITNYLLDLVTDVAYSFLPSFSFADQELKQLACIAESFLAQDLLIFEVLYQIKRVLIVTLQLTQPFLDLGQVFLLSVH